MGGCLCVVGGGMCGGEGGQRMEGGKEGVTNATEVRVLNCDCEELDVVWAFRVGGSIGGVQCSVSH